MRTVTHFMMDNWKTDGTCEEPRAIMKMIDQLFIAQRRTGNKPVVVHGMCVNLLLIHCADCL